MMSEFDETSASDDRDVSGDQRRREIAFEAARLMNSRSAGDYSRARMQAARQVARGWIPQEDMPTDREIRVELERMTRTAKPIASDDEATGESRVRTPETDQHHVTEDDRFELFEAMLRPLDRVKQNKERHPEGDVLYHSLQVFELAFEQRPWDEEFLLAALLHDVGKGIEKKDHATVALNALGDTITERTAWLIENHTLAQQINAGTIGVRAHRRLRRNEWFEDLELLAACDRAGRVSGVRVRSLHEALQVIRDLADEDAAGQRGTSQSSGH